MPDELEKSRKPRTGEAGADAAAEPRSADETKPAPARAAKPSPEPEKRGTADILGFKRKISKLRRR
jgi:hypothetical protein